MARINIEQKALTDPRFRILGNRLSPLNLASPEDVERAFGLFLAVRVWDYAQERGTDVLPGAFVEGIYPGLTEAMIEAELLEPIDGRTVRVRGWVDSDGAWLERHRATSRAGGQARAAGAKRGADGTFRPAASSRHPAALDAAGSSRASALALPPAQKEERTPIPPTGETSLTPGQIPRRSRVAATYSPGFLEAWGAYPHYEQRSSKAESWAVWQKRGLEAGTMNVLAWIGVGRVSADWTKEERKYTPAFQVWIRRVDFVEAPPGPTKAPLVEYEWAEGDLVPFTPEQLLARGGR